MKKSNGNNATGLKSPLMYSTNIWRDALLALIFPQTCLNTRSSDGEYTCGHIYSSITKRTHSDQQQLLFTDRGLQDRASFTIRILDPSNSTLSSQTFNVKYRVSPAPRWHSFPPCYQVCLQMTSLHNSKGGVFFFLLSSLPPPLTLFLFLKLNWELLEGKDLTLNP